MFRKILWKKLWTDLGRVKWSKFLIKLLSCLYTRAIWIWEVSAVLGRFWIVFLWVWSHPTACRNLRKDQKGVLNGSWKWIEWLAGLCARCGGQRRGNWRGNLFICVKGQQARREGVSSLYKPSARWPWLTVDRAHASMSSHHVDARCQHMACRDEIILSRRAIL